MNENNIEVLNIEKREEKIDSQTVDFSVVEAYGEDLTAKNI